MSLKIRCSEEPRGSEKSVMPGRELSSPTESDSAGRRWGDQKRDREESAFGLRSSLWLWAGSAAGAAAVLRGQATYLAGKHQKNGH